MEHEYGHEIAASEFVINSPEYINHRWYVVCVLTIANTGLVLVHNKIVGPPNSHGLNGPGGKVHLGESLFQAASREFLEEVNADFVIRQSEWDPIAYIGFDDAVVAFMHAEVEINEQSAFRWTVDGLPAAFVPYAMLNSNVCGYWFDKAAKRAALRSTGIRE